MKTVIKTLALVIMIATANITFAQDKKADKKSKEAEVCFLVGMDCHNCEQKIKKNVAFEKGVKDLSTDLDKKQVVIKYRSDKTDKDKLKAAIEKLGYSCEETVADNSTTTVNATKTEHSHNHKH